MKKPTCLAPALHRGEQQALLAGLHHERVTHPRIGELLAELEGSSLVQDPLVAAAVNIRELRKTYNRLTRLPRRLVEDLARMHLIWRSYSFEAGPTALMRFSVRFREVVARQRNLSTRVNPSLMISGVCRRAA
jgi:Zn-dependent M32 family carboxypeptidase